MSSIFATYDKERLMADVLRLCDMGFGVRFWGDGVRIAIV